MTAADRAFLMLAVVPLLAALLGPTSASADHDAVPFPPPDAVTRNLERIASLEQGSITISGISSGAFFAHQFHIAHSRLVNGAGLVAGGPFGCVENIPDPYWGVFGLRLDRISAAVVACTHTLGDRYFGLRPTGPKASDSIDVVTQAGNRRLIDDPAHLADDRVWLFHGRLDEVVPEGVADTLLAVYKGLKLPDQNVQDDRNAAGSAAAHGMPVGAFTGQSRFPVRKCDEHEAPFVIQCGLDAAGSLLKHLYPGSAGPASEDPHSDGSLLAFDQAEFFGTAASKISMHRVGFAFIPRVCAETACRLHIAVHGCKQDAASIHDDFVRDAGYNRWAASFRLVILYPQATPSAANPNACWDFWGYSSDDYYTQNGPQIRAVKAMVDRLLGL